MDVISLGFPEQTVPKWLNGYVYEWVDKLSLVISLREENDPRVGGEKERLIDEIEWKDYG